ncbi:MAG: NAD(P)H-dependent flavin oxidoreductase, partial [SAR324 cluster bacterium]
MTRRFSPNTGAVRALCTRLGIEHPIVQGPMGGGASTPEMAAAVCNAGGLGSLACAYLTPDQIRDGIAAIRRRTDRPFNVNLFAGGYTEPMPGFDPQPVLGVLRKHHAALGLPDPTLVPSPPNPFGRQLEAILDAHVSIFSFTFGIPAPQDLQRLRRQGVTILGTATTVAEARLLVDAGVDVVIAQGSEAGAHRGTFAVPFDAGMIGTIALVPLVVAAVGPAVPVVASGGIMDGRGIVAACALGAGGVQMGTAFLATDEAGVPEVHKKLLLSASETQTALTRAFSGRPARGIRNGFMTDMEELGDAAIPAFPLQNALTRPLRTAAAKQEDAERLSLWAGQGARMARRVSAGRLVALMTEEI